MKKIMTAYVALFLIQAHCAAKEFDASKVKALVDGQDQFAFALFNELSKPNQNTFISPYSIHTALSMTYEGAKKSTATEMADVLQLQSDEELRQGATQSLADYLLSRKNCTINIANGIWIERTNNLLKPYRKVVTNFYRAQARNVDFQNRSEFARKAINDWVAKTTQQKIKNLFAHDSINQATQFVLVNAIYFKGLWERQFDKKLTKDEPFFTEENQQRMVPLMRMTGKNAVFKYAETDDMQLLEMPYICKDLSMVILLPKNANLSLLEQKLNKDSLHNLLRQMNKQRVDVYIPRFKISTKYVLNEPLQKLGMSLPFSGSADFSGIDGTNSLFISLVVHQAFVEVNEEGTEAAAATGIVMTKLAPMRPQEIPVFRADHPFIFVIKENKTGALLFMGKVVEPQS